MFQRIFATALGAGVAVGLIVAVLQHFSLVPLILEAEKYEDGILTVQHKHTQLVPRPDDIGGAIAGALPAVVGQAQAQEHEHPTVNAAGITDDSPWRAVFTFIATTLTAIGFALLLAGAFAVSGRAVNAREGLLWGLAGFTAFALAPAFGLPPELPGSVAAEITSRQIWWIGTMAATVIGLGLLVFVRRTWAIPVAIALLIAPHLIGAPHPHEGAGLVPPELAATFAARSLGVNAVLWALLGLATGGLYARFGRSSTA
jgi:cobalt transporter subunit CbtA